MNPQDKSTTRKGYGKRPRCRPRCTGLRAPGEGGEGWLAEGAPREDVPRVHTWPLVVGGGQLAVVGQRQGDRGRAGRRGTWLRAGRDAAAS